jgi:hypothetical protein
MKTLKTLSKVIFAAGVMALAVACSKNTDSTNPYVYPNGLYPGGCATCVGGMPGAGGGGMVTAQFKTPYQEAVGSINIISQGGSQVIVQGQIQITSQNFYTCYAQPGTYQIQTMQPGMYSGNGTITGLVFQAGPLTFQVSQAYLVNASGSNYRLSIVNGMLPCGSVTTN